MTSPFQVKNMLRVYTTQLINARRLARFRHMARATETDEPQATSREEKRTKLVERIAREVIDNLLVTGSESPLIDEIKETLEREIGARLSFRYPLVEGDMQIYRRTPSGEEEVPPEERDMILSRLWQITLAKVDDTML